VSALSGYAAAAAELIPRYEALDPAALYAPVLPYLPAAPGRLLDVGAGTGRDAAWFAARGWQALAVEPVAAFRAAGARHGAAVAWLDDALPDLARVAGPPFDLVLVNAVWHHLDPAARTRAWPRLATLTAPGGALVLSLRHGPAPPDRPGFPAPAAEALAHARAAGFRPAFVQDRPSLQPANAAAGVAWTWMALAAP
jgi:SAM-dependent methyltransferase